MSSSTVSTGQGRENPVAVFSRFMDKFKPQMALALPKHLTADRMARLALTQFSTNVALQSCTPQSIAASIMTASILGLEPGVNGQGYLIPYKAQCTFVPGWKGLVDIANRSGRVSVWTGAVFQGDQFDYALGDTPFVRHQPGDEDDPAKMTHVYAIGRVNGSNWPVIEVWSMRKIWKHRDQYNKVGQRHYSFRDQEMYARKVPLLQVLKYMPASIELSNALAVSNAAEEGRGAVIDGNFVTINDPDPADQQDQGRDDTTYCSAEAFDAQKAAWMGMVTGGKKTVNDLIATIETREKLTPDQKVEIASWAVTKGETS